MGLAGIREREGLPATGDRPPSAPRESRGSCAAGVHLFAGAINGIDAEALGLPRGEQGDQGAACQMGVNRVGGLQADPRPVQGGGQQQVGDVGAEVATHRDGFGTIGPQKLPQALAEIGVGEAVVQCQILHLLRRSMAGQVGGAGAHHRVAGAEPAGHQVGIEVVGDAQGEIDSLLHQIDRPVQQQDVDRRAGVTGQVVVRRPDQQGFGERVAAGDAQLPLGGLVMADGQVFHLFPQGQHGSGPVQRLFSWPGQAQPAGGAVQQSGPHPAFQLGQVARHHGTGHLQFLPGAA